MAKPSRVSFERISKLPRVVFLGNSNNEPFRLAHEFSRSGFDVDLIVLSQSALDDPRHLTTSRYFAGSAVRVDYSFRDRSQWDWFIASRRLPLRLGRVLGRADLVVANSVGLGLTLRLDAPHFSYLTGSDATEYTRASLADEIPLGGARTFLRAAIHGKVPSGVVRSFVDSQRRGVATSRLIVSMARGLSADLDAAIAAAGADSVPRASWAASTYPPSPTPQRRQLPNGSDEVQVLLGARLTEASSSPWRRSDLDDKGSEIALAGWARARAEGLRGRLTVFAKGTAVNAMQRLAVDLGIDGDLRWLPEGGFNHFLTAVAEADVVIDSVGKAPPGRVSIEALALGRIVVARAPIQVQDALLGVHFPTLLAAHDAATVASRLWQADEMRKDAKLAASARDLALRHLSPGQRASSIIDAARVTLGG